MPPLIIAIETDQLFLGDVAELWDHVLASMDNDDLVAAAENYQPWISSSSYSDSEDASVRYLYPNSTNAVNHDGSYHGYGLIGGIMCLRIDRMKEIDWPSLFVQTFIEYRGGSNWKAQLNDQDIFNAVFTMLPQHLYILPCEWNVQLHARLNSILFCHHSLSHVLQESVPTAKCTFSPSPSPSQTQTQTRISAEVSSQTKGTSLSCELNPEGAYPEDWSFRLLDFFSQNERRIDDIPLNCEAAAANKIFVCPHKAKVLHFMASGYSNYDFLNYYNGYWELYKTSSWQLAV